MLLFVDGFDHWASADAGKKNWAYFGGSVSTTAGRRGGGALNAGANGSYRNLSVLATTMIAGIARKDIGAIESDVSIGFSNGGTVGVIVYPISDGSLRVANGAGTVLGTSSPGIWIADVWNYVELKAVWGTGTAGSFVVRLNGLAVLTVSGVNTAASTSSGYSTLYTGGTGGSGGVYFDDLYVCDSTGATNNDFLGDCRVDTLFPNADGTYADLTPSTGSTHYVLVDETAPNAADYNSSTTVGHKDSYQFQNLPALTTQVVYGVQVNLAISKDNSGTREATTMARSSSTDAFGASVGLSTGEFYISQVYEQDPNITAAWTETTVNSAQFGCKVTA